MKPIVGPVVTGQALIAPLPTPSLLHPATMVHHDTPTPKINVKPRVARLIRRPTVQPVNHQSNDIESWKAHHTFLKTDSSEAVFKTIDDRKKLEIPDHIILAALQNPDSM